MTRRSLGELEQQILLTLLRLGSEAYTVEIVRTLSEVTGRDISPTGAHVVLSRLEKKGLLTSRIGGPTPERGGRPRRYFRVLDEALPVLRGNRQALRQLWEGLDPILEEPS